MSKNKSLDEIMFDDQFDFDRQFIELQKEYLTDLPDKIDDFEKVVLTLEETNNFEETMRKILGLAHSIKGSSGSYGLDFISTIFHNLEDYMSEATSKGEERSKFTSKILKFIDLAREYATAFVADTADKSKFQKKLESLEVNSSQSVHRVLVLENTASMANAYQQVLSPYNIQISYVKDGYAALGRLLREKFDSLITVQESNLIDGQSLISTIKNLKSPNKNINSILITSNKNYEPPQQNSAEYILLKKQDLFRNLEDIYKNLLKESGIKVMATSETPIVEKATLEKLVYIDDDSDIQLMVQLGLKSMKNVSSKFYGSGKEALEELPNEVPDLILLDVIMPEMDGEQVFKELQKHPELKKVPVVFLTAKTRGSEIQKLRDLGAIDIISKPFNPRSLPKQIESIWQKVTGQT